MKKLGFMAMLGMLVGVSACTGVSEIETSEAGIVNEEVVITATQELGPETRTVLQDDGSVWWKPNDAIGVFFGSHCSKFYAYNMEDAPVAYFIGNALVVQGNTENSGGDPGTYTYWGVFPPELSNSYTEDKLFDYSIGNQDYETPTREGESVNVYLPERQRGVAGTFDSNNFISIAKSNDYKTLSFYNLCGGLAFCVETEGINKVTFAGNAGESLAGKVNVVMDSEGHPVVSQVRNSKTEVTLAMNAGETFVPGEWYYIVMLPTVLEEGYTMTFYKGKQVGTVVSDSPVEIKRSVFGRLTNPDSGVVFGSNSEYTPIVIDGDFSDWDARTAVEVAVCDPDSRWTALTVLKACADDEYVYVYFSFDEDQIYDRSWVPVYIYLDADNSPLTGGKSLGFSDASVDLLFDGAVFADGSLCSYDASMCSWAGEVGGEEWNWGYVMGAGQGLTYGAGSGTYYELAIARNLGLFELAETFGLGVSIMQEWNDVGVLPNAAVTEDNPNGEAPLLRITTER